MSSWSIHFFLCLGGLRRLSRRTCWAGGCPARSRARRRASFAALYFLRDFFLAKVWVKRQTCGPGLLTRALDNAPPLKRRATHVMAEACWRRTHHPTRRRADRRPCKTRRSPDTL